MRLGQDPARRGHRPRRPGQSEGRHSATGCRTEGEAAHRGGGSPRGHPGTERHRAAHPAHPERRPGAAGDRPGISCSAELPVRHSRAGRGIPGRGARSGCRAVRQGPPAGREGSGNRSAPHRRYGTTTQHAGERPTRTPDGGTVGRRYCRGLRGRSCPERGSGEHDRFAPPTRTDAGHSRPLRPAAATTSSRGLLHSC